MELKQLRLSALEVFETLNNLNPIYMKELCQKTKFLTHRPSNLQILELTFFFFFWLLCLESGFLSAAYLAVAN